MGEVIERITLVNARDAGNARSGFIKATDVRQLTVDAIVDTGAGPLVISDAMRQRLGLEIEMNEVVNLAGGVRQECTVSEAVKIIWKDRYALSCPIVLPAGDEILLGVIPLEDMYLRVNPVDRCLEKIRGNRWLHRTR
jgi:predicted aspartyl protease